MSMLSVVTLVWLLYALIIRTVVCDGEWNPKCNDETIKIKEKLKKCSTESWTVSSKDTNLIDCCSSMDSVCIDNKVSAALCEVPEDYQSLIRDNYQPVVRSKCVMKNILLKQCQEVAIKVINDPICQQWLPCDNSIIPIKGQIPPPKENSLTNPSDSKSNVPKTEMRANPDGGNVNDLLPSAQVSTQSVESTALPSKSDSVATEVVMNASVNTSVTTTTPLIITNSTKNGIQSAVNQRDNLFIKLIALFVSIIHCLKFYFY
ncbi:uncharacterized protein LOC128959676 [Oppia nitens]|uniref:uncharacterized protein LOC128959676 n=1 Tax=Oppia nitens TaxID=1686743 RepID=UPI0023DA40CF|nr:uncharacterized protein LOC128959676 [Oppia nitens]